MTVSDGYTSIIFNRSNNQKTRDTSWSSTAFCPFVTSEVLSKNCRCTFPALCSKQDVPGAHTPEQEQGSERTETRHTT